MRNISTLRICQISFMRLNLHKSSCKIYCSINFCLDRKKYMAILKPKTGQIYFKFVFTDRMMRNYLKTFPYISFLLNFYTCVITVIERKLFTVWKEVSINCPLQITCYLLKNNNHKGEMTKSIRNEGFFSFTNDHFKATFHENSEVLNINGLALYKS